VRHRVYYNRDTALFFSIRCYRCNTRRLILWRDGENSKAFLKNSMLKVNLLQSVYGLVLLKKPMRNDGDSVTVIKDLKVKGSSSTLKQGTKVKNIRLVDGDHNIDCKIDGFGAMSLKSEYVKKI
jgi:alkylphosphonate utilization operon protein PhnA